MAYNLDKIVQPTDAIYQQLTEFYTYNEHIRRLSKATLSGQMSDINYFVRFSGLKDLREITNAQIYAWISYQVDQGNKGSTVNARLKRLIAMLRWQRDDNLSMPGLKISRIPLQKEEPPKRTYYTREQIYKALQYADRREWLWIKMMFDCGFRVSELRMLRLSQIDGDVVQFTGKGRKTRPAILSKEVVERLQDWVTREQIEDYLWPSGRSKREPISVKVLREQMRKPFEHAGIYGACPHDLRRSYATDLKRLNVPTRRIQQGLGHASELTTECYLRDLDGAEVRDIYDVKYSAPEPPLR